MIQRIFLVFLCGFLASQPIIAVVNNAAVATSAATEPAISSTLGESNSASNSGKAQLVDSIAAASNEQEANRREAPIVPHEVYGPPSPIPANPGLPIPIYGVPDGSPNNVIYPGASADTLPSIPSNLPTNFVNLNELYGPPKSIYGPPLKETYGPPKEVYGPPKSIFGLPPFKYGAPPQIPASFPKLPKPHFGGPLFKPKVQYGAPIRPFGAAPFVKPAFKPKPIYGPPKVQYGPPKALFVPAKPAYTPLKQYGPPPSQPIAVYGPPPSASYGPPKATYGPPDPVPHGPPHPGAPAPPTPPDIKYDGWHPMPGLVSRPPSDSYGVPKGEAHSIGDLQFNHDFIPPPAVSQGVSSLSLGSSYGSSAGISDSYGAPLNTVTGSGGIVSTSGDAHIHNQEQNNAISLGLTAAGIGNGHDGQLSVIKSIGYEIFPNGVAAGHEHNNLGIGSDSYSAPPANAFSSNGPYALSNPFKQQKVTGNVQGNVGKGLSFSTSHIGLIPPSGMYGVPQIGQGTPLLHNSQKKPIFFNDAISQGFIQSIGQQIATTGIVENHLEEPRAPSSLFSLPQSHTSVQFQSNPFVGQAQALTSYAAPLKMGAPQHGGFTVGLDYSHPSQTIDLTHLGTSSFTNTIPHDCSAHKSQPLPQLSYGVPSANSYTASLSSLTTNIGGNPSSHPLPGSDLETAFSVAKPASVSQSIQDKDAERYQYSVADGLVPGGELIKSQSIDFSNIPLQGQLGTYSLQIQAADGPAGSGSSSLPLPHEQVLNDGLLQSILAAIEQPQQKGAAINVIPAEQQAQVQISPDLQLPSAQVPIMFIKNQDDEAQDSVNKQVVVVAPSTTGAAMQGVAMATDESKTSDEDLQLIDDNEIALYFSNHMQHTNDTFMNTQEVKEDEKDAQPIKEAAKTGQSVSYVSYEAPAANYAYGDLKAE